MAWLTEGGGWEGVLAAYGDGRFVPVCLVTAGVSAAVFLGLALPLTLLAHLDPPRLRHLRVQGRPIPARRWAGRALKVYALNGALSAGAMVAAWPLVRGSGVHAGPWPAAWAVAAQVAFLFVLDDALYYGLHRLLHTPWLYRRVHALHHRVTTPCALTGHYMHPLEFGAVSLLVMGPPLLLGVHVGVLWLWVALRQALAALGHCGYQLPVDPLRLIPTYRGAAFHDFHHRRFRGNYASALDHLDRLLGTLAPGYAEDVARRRGARAGGRAPAHAHTAARSDR
jgi:4-alpha-methyl-delta7-sterol-4alpha-methyl oxidase